MTTPLNTFGASLAPGQFAEFASPSLTALYDGVARVFEPSAVARADAQANGWLALHMADWWSHLPHDPVTDTYWIAGGRNRDRALAQNLVSYDANSNTWTHRANWSGLPGGHCYQSTAVGGGKVYSYHLNGTTVWDMAAGAVAGSIPLPPNSVVPGYSSAVGIGFGLTFVPWMGVEGSLLWVVCNQNSSDPSRALSRIFRRDFALNDWVPILGQRNLWNNQHTLALPSKHQQTILVGASTAAQPRPLGVLDAQGNMTLLPVGPMNATTGGSSSSRALLVEHPERHEPIFFCLATRRIWSLPPGGSAWLDRGPVPSALLNDNSVAMPTSFGAAFARYQNAGRSKMYAWKPDF